MSVSNEIEKMRCYIITNSQPPDQDKQESGENNENNENKSYDMDKLESGYKQYARIFEDVKLVLSADQAKESFLNYPHVCNKSDSRNFSDSLKTILEDSDGEYVFIGSSDIDNFSLELPLNLIRQYDGESFLGYTNDTETNKNNFHFGIYNKKLLGKLNEIPDGDTKSVEELLATESRLVEFPEGLKIL